MSGVMTLRLQLGVLADVARVLVAAHVPPRPAVEAAFLHVGDVVGDEVVAEAIALIGRAPQLAGDGVDGFADAVADAPGVDLDELAVGRELEDIGAVEFLRVGVGVVDVGVRADGGEELAAVFGEDQVAGPVAAAAQASAAGQVGEVLHGAGGLQVAVLDRGSGRWRRCRRCRPTADWGRWDRRRCRRADGVRWRRRRFASACRRGLRRERP